MIFDCLNEALDFHRVYGLKGASVGLKPQSLKFQDHNKASLPGVLLKSAQKVIEWSTFMCGFIPYKEDSFIQVPKNLDEDTFNQIKEDRLQRFLSDEVGSCDQVYSGDDKWVTHEEEMLEVQVELSDMVFEFLVADTVYCLLKINQKGVVNEGTNRLKAIETVPPFLEDIHPLLTQDSV